MSKFKKVAGKTWVFAAATAVIVGSSSTMAFALNQNAYSATAVPSATKHVQTPSNPPQASGGYTVVDESKTRPSQPPTDFVNNLDNQGLTTQQIDEKYHEMIARNTPSSKDMSAQQAAAYAAAILKQAYGVNFKGYTAMVIFQNPQVPNSAQWSVTFYAPNGVNDTKRYSCSVNSVTGTIFTADAYNLSPKQELSYNLSDSSWKTTADRDISKLLPKNVSVTSSKVIDTSQWAGVSVVSNLSNGAAFAVRLSGKDKFADAYQYFPNGYDGSWSLGKPGPSTNAVG
jgi:hypothetical protein